MEVIGKRFAVLLGVVLRDSVFIEVFDYLDVLSKQVRYKL